MSTHKSAAHRDFDTHHAADGSYVRIMRVHSSDDFDRARWTVNGHHSYIDFVKRPSRELHWLIVARTPLAENDDVVRTVGVFSLGSAYVQPKAVADEIARAGLAFNEVANNIVFCLTADAPMNAGTRALALLRADAVRWWRERYGDDLRAVQTFVLPPRTGAVYRADNWRAIGMTAGAAQRTSSTVAPPSDGRSYYVQTIAGETRYVVREYVATERKVILWRQLSDRERRRALAAASPAQPSLF